MQIETFLILAQPLSVPANWAAVSAEGLTAIETAIAAESLLGRVSNGAENERAQRARATLKTLKSRLETTRKKLKEPILEYGRILDRNVNKEIERLDREDGRLEHLQKEFLIEDNRRILEEQRKQREEQERIERERQAELRRIENERLEAERKAREAQEAAERAAAEARTKKQRAEAARLQREADEKAAQATKAAITANNQTALVNENAELNLRVESAPIEVTRAAGQVNRKKWKIKTINDFQLVKARPDLVRKIEWNMVEINQLLNQGVTLSGVTAEEDFSISARSSKQPTVDV